MYHFIFLSIFINLDEIEKIENYCIIFFLFTTKFHSSSVILKKYRKSTAFSLFRIDPVSARLSMTCTPGFPPSPWVSFTRTLVGHTTLTMTLTSGQIIHGVRGVALIIFVLNVHESWLLRVFLIDYKSNRELEK